MSDVERSAYRRPVTASGLEAIERGTLTWLDEDMYNNLNTGVLEQYLEEKNFEESFEISHWDTRKVLIGILIGAVFSGVTAYIGLKIGLAVSAAWYVAYLLGMALRGQHRHQRNHWGYSRIDGVHLHFPGDLLASLFR